jgi:hypothetical protein
MKHYTEEVSSVRSKYWFSNRSVKFDPSECWYLVYRDLQTQVIQRFKKVSIPTQQDELLRDNTECPCCLEKLEGMLFKCDNNHQIDFKCFDNLNHNNYTPRKCPVCRIAYNILEVRRFDEAKGKKEIITQEIHFTGSRVQREYKLVGLIKSILGNDSTNNLIESIINAGLFYYVMETHLPLLEDKGNHSIFTLDLLDNQAWKDFLVYIKTDRFKEIIYSKGKSFSTPYNYDETTFLRHLSLKYGNDAMNILTEATRDRCGQSKNTLKFKMYYEFVYLEEPQEEIINRFKKLVSKCFTKNDYHRKTWDLIESEITE